MRDGRGGFRIPRDGRGGGRGVGRRYRDRWATARGTEEAERETLDVTAATPAVGRR